MKRMTLKLSALFLALVLLLSLICSCGSASCVVKEEYSSTATHNLASSEFAYLDDTLDFVYEDTTLKIYDDGTWCIDMPIILFITSKIDQGTYTVDENGLYEFEGFEYGMDAYGKETDSGFEIYFRAPTVTGYETLFTLYFG